MAFLKSVLLAFFFIGLCESGKEPCAEDCTGENEVFTETDNHPCQNTCEEPFRIASCTYAPGKYPGCVCSEGYLRDKDGNCVDSSQCYTCGENEEFSKCGAHGCQNTCTAPDLVTRCDPAPGCFPGCVCKPAYLRDTNTGKCVVAQDCSEFPPCDGPNEEYDTCGTACPLTCENKNKDIICTEQCVAGCFCKKGYVRDADNVCVLPKQCPGSKECTGPHEEYSECGNDSCQKNCDTYDLNLQCRPACNSGCICNEGYIRNQKGICVLPEECENRKCTGKNEAFTTCVCPCCERCATLGQEITCNFLVCNPGCDCKPGFFRNSKGVCVPPEKCDCGKNEELDLCYQSCPPRTCDAIGKAFKCPGPDPDNCKPGCKCKFNYRRNSDGVCVPVKDCPPLKCTGKNEVYSACPEQCLDERCESLYDPLACIAVVTECAPRCICKKGYLRDKTGTCIPKEKCVEYCSESNTVYNPCGDVNPLTCANKDKLRIRAKDCMKVGGCVCQPGYARDIYKKCIPIEDCPTCSDSNEVFACGSPCDSVCATLGQPCLIEHDGCVEKCYCIDGYARNGQNVCIPIKQCPKIPCKNPNETYNPCPPICPPEETCESYLSGLITVCAEEPEPGVCKPRCECKAGFVRKNKGGECILAKNCCDDPNAEVVECPNPCPGGTCQSPKFADCKAPCKLRGCQCKKGYVKDTIDRCILLSKCPVCKKNQEYRFGTVCPATCSNRNPVCTKQAVEGCFCNEGYILDKDKGDCILIKDCPKKCGSNEEFNKCGTACPATCDNRNPICTEQCVPGCFCKKGFVLDKPKGKCIPVGKCPQKCGLNEEYNECGTACPATCSNRNPICTEQCVAGCFCKTGYILDKDKGTCICIDKCPPRCTGQNEEYQECGTACPKTCENRFKNVPCITLCVEGCFCKSGFVRKNGKCVREEECDCGENEVYSDKAPAEQETCATLGRKPSKTAKCKPGCVCETGYVRKYPKGKCIKISKCKRIRKKSCSHSDSGSGSDSDSDSGSGSDSNSDSCSDEDGSNAKNKVSIRVKQDGYK